VRVVLVSRKNKSRASPTRTTIARWVQSLKKINNESTTDGTILPTRQKQSPREKQLSRKDIDKNDSSIARTRTARKENSGGSGGRKPGT